RAPLPTTRTFTVPQASTASVCAMPYVVATTDGLIQIDDRGRLNRLAEGSFLHVVPGEDDGEAVALDDQGQIWDIDEEGAAPYESFNDGRATCLLVDGADVWLGTDPAAL